MENRALGGHIISFSAGNTLFCRKRPRPDLSGEALRRTVSGLRPLRRPSRRSVRLPFRIDPFGFRIAPFGSCMIPLRPAPSLSRPILTPARLPLLYPGARIIPLLFSRRSGSHSFCPAEPPRRLEQKNRLFFGVFVKFLLLLHHIAVTTLYPRRNGLHAASASLLTREFR